MNKQRILIVDDEEDICMILSYSLQKAGYETLIAHSAEDALALLLPTSNCEYPIANNPSPISLILLDIMMDGMSGLEMANHLRLDNVQSDNLPPIIFLTALSDESTLLQGFNLGADDYITKPFRVPEVIARVGAVLRRTAAMRREGRKPTRIASFSRVL